MNDKKLITVFTPAYNRADLLPNCYESLQKQSSYNFEWLIVDDGSTDNTDEIVKAWQKSEKNFEIKYCCKENGGLHTAYNKGIELADTELFVCIDSDDIMPPDAIEKIETIWNEIPHDKYAGIMGVDRYENGECVGEMFPDGISEMYLYEKLTKYKIPGDKKMIHRTELLKKVAPMPSYGNEKNFNPSYLMYQLDAFGKLYVTNECFCTVYYQPNGMSSNIYKQYCNSPRSFAETRKLYLAFPGISPAFKLRHSIHYMSSCIIAKRFFKGISESPCPLYSVIGIIPAVLLTCMVLVKGRE